MKSLHPIKPRKREAINPLGLSTIIALTLALFLAGPLADNVFEPMFVAHGLAWRTGLTNLIGAGPGRGAAFLLILSGVLALAITMACYFNRRLRNVEDELPDAIAVRQAVVAI
jgi:hypothetical protein